MSAQHTPGPWAWFDDPFPDDPFPGHTYARFSIGDDNFTAIITPEDARLIAAAPELLAALKLLLNCCIGSPVPGGDGETFIVHPPTPTAIKTARCAIAKAEQDQ